MILVLRGVVLLVSHRGTLHHRGGRVQGHGDAGLHRPGTALVLGHRAVDQLSSAIGLSRGKAVHDGDGAAAGNEGAQGWGSALVTKGEKGCTGEATALHDNSLTTQIAVVDAAEREGSAPLALCGEVIKDNEVIEMVKHANGGLAVSTAAAAEAGLANLHAVGVYIHVCCLGENLVIAAAGPSDPAEKAFERRLVHDDGVNQLAGEVLAVAASVDGHVRGTHGASNKWLSALVHLD